MCTEIKCTGTFNAAGVKPEVVERQELKHWTSLASQSLSTQQTRSLTAAGTECSAACRQSPPCAPSHSPGGRGRLPGAGSELHQITPVTSPRWALCIAHSMAPTRQNKELIELLCTLFTSHYGPVTYQLITPQEIYTEQYNNFTLEWNILVQQHWFSVDWGNICSWYSCCITCENLHLFLMFWCFSHCCVHHCASK